MTLSVTLILSQSEALGQPAGGLGKSLFCFSLTLPMGEGGALNIIVKMDWKISLLFKANQGKDKSKVVYFTRALYAELDDNFHTVLCVQTPNGAFHHRRSQNADGIQCAC